MTCITSTSQTQTTLVIISNIHSHYLKHTFSLSQIYILIISNHYLKLVIISNYYLRLVIISNHYLKLSLSHLPVHYLKRSTVFIISKYSLSHLPIHYLKRSTIFHYLKILIISTAQSTKTHYLK